jgi:hypothetical protein
MAIRPVKRITPSTPHTEGAGVKLRRAFGFGDTSAFDPFLLMDDFRNDRPEDYRAGFPWHPHRGIETITYMLAGTVEHKDSLGNHGRLGPGDAQWMTAGSGILHQEMPMGDERGRMHGFQLWANLPARLKMTAPRYQDVKAADIPEVVGADGARVRVICGDHEGTKGAVEGVAAGPRYFDVALPGGSTKTIAIEPERNAFAYVFEGEGAFSGARAANHALVLFDAGEAISVAAGKDGVRFLLVSGRPLNEPVAWYGPIVMNTQAELRQAIAELDDGTFIKA